MVFFRVNLKLLNGEWDMCAGSFFRNVLSGCSAENQPSISFMECRNLVYRLLPLLLLFVLSH